MEDIKGRPYDLLDFTVTQFDRDILEFNVHINELELALKVGLGACPIASPAAAIPWPCPSAS